MGQDNVRPLRAVAGRIVGRDGIRKLVRVKHPEYGTGHIAADFDTLGIQIYWDHPSDAGFAQHLNLHDRSWVEKLERID